MGVRPDKLATLFDAFSQVQDGQVTGTGLGLFSVRTRAEGLGGCCGARPNTQSSTGTGTVIWFSLPYVPDVPIDVHYHMHSQSHAVTHPACGRVSRSPMNTPVIVPAVEELTIASASELARHTEEYIKSQQLTAMVVDDTLTVCKLMKRVLLNMGFVNVECYGNGSKGLEAMMAQQVDIVFSDVQMPIMTGPEVHCITTTVSAMSHSHTNPLCCIDGGPLPSLRGGRPTLRPAHRAAAGGGGDCERLPGGDERQRRLRRDLPQAPELQ